MDNSLNFEPTVTALRYTLQGADKWDKPGTLEEKLFNMARAAREQGIEFNVVKERRILKGGKRTPYFAINGLPCRTAKLRDKTNNEILRQLRAFDKGESTVNPLPWLTGGPGDSFAPNLLPQRDAPHLVPQRNNQSFEDLWNESREELINSGGYSFIDGILRETPLFFAKDGIGVAYVTFNLKRDGLFTRLWKAVKEAARG